MAKVEEIIKETITKLPRKDLEKLVLKAAQKDRSFHDYMLVNYANKEFGEQDLFDKAKADLEFLFRKSYRGFSEELQLANMLAACHKRINDFGKVCKQKEKELTLIMLVLRIPFSLSTNMFCTCFTAYNHKVYLLLKKTVTLYESKIHQDYRIEFYDMLNEYLVVFHRTSSHLDYVHTLKKSVSL